MKQYYNINLGSFYLFLKKGCIIFVFFCTAWDIFGGCLSLEYLKDAYSHPFFLYVEKKLVNVNCCFLFLIPDPSSGTGNTLTQ